MKSFPILTIAAFILAGLSVSAADDGDFQTWLNFNVQGNLSENVKIRLDQELYYMDDSSDYTHHHTDVGFQWAANKQWLLGANYRESFDESNGVWKEEHRPHLNLTYKWNYQEVSLSNRSRLELRIRDGRSHIVRYRNKTTATFPFEWTNMKLRPYLAEEIFIDSDHGEYNQNRAFAGFKATLHEHVKGAVYYMWQSVDKGDFWSDAHIFGLNLSFVL